MKSFTCLCGKVYELSIVKVNNEIHARVVLRAPDPAAQAYAEKDRAYIEQHAEADKLSVEKLRSLGSAPGTISSPLSERTKRRLAKLN